MADKNRMPSRRICIVSPATQVANNGNWQTAARWASLLETRHEVTIVQEWTGTPCDVMLALHARRSSTSITRWAAARGMTENCPGLAVVLTGTDLYRDIARDEGAMQSLRLADALVTLQELGPNALPLALRPKARVIFQSSPARTPWVRSAGPLEVVMVGHLREEKAPQTLWAAARLLHSTEGVVIRHIGDALDPELGRQAKACMQACPQYTWLGGLPHATALDAIAQAHLLVQSSRIEGGAHAVLEAVRAGTPVLASRIDGNVGMLGRDYEGYFELDDAPGLASLLLECRDTLAEPGGFYAWLRQQCDQRSPLFAPEVEAAALFNLVDQLVPVQGRSSPDPR